MAEACISVAKDQFNCSVCLHLLRDPVTIPCGHSYCLGCITYCWNTDDPDPFCTGRKRKAVKSCFMCLESYCQTHFKCHEESPLRKRHKVTDATERLQVMICPQHDRLLELFCRTDQRCICLMCLVDEHKNHDTVSAEVERAEKQEKVGEMQGKYQQSVQERQKKLQELREAVETHKLSAQSAVENIERIFTELIRSIEKSCSELTQIIRDQERAEVSQAEGLMKRLEREIDDLRRRDTEVEQLSQTDDHIHYLQSFQSLSVPHGSTDSISITSLSYEDVVMSVRQLRGNLQDFCDEEIECVYGKVSCIKIISTTQPKTREYFLDYSHQLTLDPNTANKKNSVFLGETE